jgi:hypothetical protein
MVRHTGEDFTCEECVAVSSMPPLQSSSIYRSELDAPQANRFATDSDASLGKKILDKSVAEVESVVQTDCVTDDIWWEPVSFICIHWQILPIIAT